ncbi:hypothetical protein RB180_05445 [Enterococcus faecalis]|uniref:hypothetical protein n=1 Tax=Enterococcus faecalis TaxID=1351 RepID=UPI0027DC7986|nr:hypothetical protein [Enterococcus faecalis]MDQ4457833.1 hypothetical protein [Enterococcus faecalis]
MKSYFFTLFFSMFSLFVILLWFSGYDSKGFLLALTDFLGFSIIHQTPVLDTYYSQQPLTTRILISSGLHFCTYFCLGLVIDLLRKGFKKIKK